MGRAGGGVAVLRRDREHSILIQNTPYRNTDKDVLQGTTLRSRFIVGYCRTCFLYSGARTPLFRSPTPYRNTDKDVLQGADLRSALGIVGRACLKDGACQSPNQACSLGFSLIF